jgi:hypothetical protein
MYAIEGIDAIFYAMPNIRNASDSKQMDGAGAISELTYHFNYFMHLGLRSSQTASNCLPKEIIACNKVCTYFPQIFVNPPE